MSHLPPRAYAAAACLAFVAACDISLGLPRDGDDQCVDRAEFCPNLQCPDGFAVNADGCEICDCAGGGPSLCLDDAQCSGGRVCDTRNFCEPGPDCQDGQPCDGVCWGLCVLPQAACSSDADCRDGEFCNFVVDGERPDDGQTDPAPPDQGGGGSGGAEPAPPPPDEDVPVAPAGVCTPLGCGFVQLPACPPGSEPIFDFTTDPCGDGKCVPVDACRALDPTACEQQSGCVLEFVQCPCDPNTGACPDCAVEVCVSAGDVCAGLDFASCALTPACEGFFVDSGCTSSCDENGVCTPCEATPQDFLCLPRTSDGTCASDADCLQGDRCAIAQTCVSTCTTDGSGADVCTDACFNDGRCTPAERTCWDLTPDECELDPACELGDGFAPPSDDCICDPSTPDCGCSGGAPAPAAFCRPREAPPCFDDGACGVDQHCAIDVSCPTCTTGMEPGCAAPCWVEGRCIDGAPPPAACSDGTTCPEGTACEEATVCTDCAQPAPVDGGSAPPACTGTCETTTYCLPVDPPTLCLDDQGCAADERCNLDVCGTSAADGAERPAQCMGVCEQVPPQYCYSDFDCTSDQFCDYAQGCWGGSNALVAQCGTCAPKETGVDGGTEPPADGTYCLSHEDCGQGGSCRDPNEAVAREEDAGLAQTICLSNPNSGADVCWGYCIQGCGDALTPAHPPGSDQCTTFVDTCVPPGWESCATATTP